MIKEWIAALRSGKYLQGYKRLRIKINNEFRYCCLAVGADVIDPTKWMDIDGVDCYLDQVHYGFLPEETLKKLGISSDQQRELIVMNDDRGKTFLEIADYIEQNMMVN